MFLKEVLVLIISPDLLSNFTDMGLLPTFNIYMIYDWDIY